MKTEPTQAQRKSLVASVKKLVADGLDLEEACSLVGIAPEAYEAWKRGKATPGAPEVRQGKRKGRPPGPAAPAPTLESLAAAVGDLRRRVERLEREMKVRLDN